MNSAIPVLLSAGLALALSAPAGASPQSRSIKPAYVSPRDLSDMLGATEYAGAGVLRWSADGAEHLVTLRRNDSANLLVIEGESADLDHVAAQAAVFDVAPRQISLEARIIEVDTDAARDLGVDWSAIRSNASVNWRGDFLNSWRSSRYETVPTPTTITDRTKLESGTTSAQAGASLSDALHLLEEKGAANFHDAPRLLTLNNRPATVLDGYRVTYVNKANGYANIHQTETMDAGLRLEVTPSLGESGYLKLDLEAELSNLVQMEFASPFVASRDFASISGSPVKRGQILRNTVMAKDGETIVLAGFTRTVDTRSRRRFPVLGAVLPFLFSRESVTQRHHESIIVITPRVVDLASGVGAREKELLEGK